MIAGTLIASSIEEYKQANAAVFGADVAARELQAAVNKADTQAAMDREEAYQAMIEDRRKQKKAGRPGREAAKKTRRMEREQRFRPSPSMR
jgi:hypothetical protein